ncbi:MAG: hypothetical protein PHR68_04400 [Candidatus Gracilibacteria bacterium]|nr:hypothetical protein [Candidatus Gracilibacteria bacterium]
MEFFLYIGTNLEYFKLLNEGNLLSKGKSDRDLASFFMQNFPGELAQSISPQYEINFMAIREIKKRFGQEVFDKIDGIYYGSDNCEYLIPYKNELEEAMELFREFNKNFPPHKTRTFTLVTPYVGNKMLAKLEESLEYLNSLNIKNPLEIVVNDLGVLRLINTKYTNLKPVFGRLIHKLLKTPLIDTYGYGVHPAGELIKNKKASEIQVLKDEIIKWQLKFYSSREISLQEYRGFLERYKIERVAIDFMEKREELYKDSSNIGIDLYYPWALVFTGRLCDTSSIENPERGNYAIDDICPRTCNRYDIFYKLKTVGYNLIQRGNSAYRSELNLDYLPDEFIQEGKNRFIFAPFITV